MIASIDATSRGSAECDVELSSMEILSTEFQHLHCRVVSGDTTNSAASRCARSAKKHIFVFRLNTPRPDLVSTLSKWKGRRVMKNVSVIHAQRVFYVYGTFAFDAWAAIARLCKATFDRLFQPLVGAG